jgi:hypothetical protein
MGSSRLQHVGPEGHFNVPMAVSLAVIAWNLQVFPSTQDMRLRVRAGFFWEEACA